ncbi:MAG: hypothetical protein GY696_32125 [Gammaproteobacteria bacterium]|nr:hypothetical protein [Gammaproteobacteria bacterium]
MSHPILISGGYPHPVVVPQGAVKPLYIVGLGVVGWYEGVGHLQPSQQLFQQLVHEFFAVVRVDG